MPMAKSKKSVGLGNTLMNDRFGKGKGSDRRRGGAGITRTNHTTGEQYITNDHSEASWVKMRSITEQGPLDEFLSTAQLAGTDFTAQKMNNVKIIQTGRQANPYLLTDAEERQALRRHREHRARLTVPRRPAWDASTTPEQLDQREREAFLAWRRGLAELQEDQDLNLLMTPFERNIEVWRQLWRVIERSDLVVQIVDARNPLLFRSADLEDYVQDVGAGRKRNLLLINKADMMTDGQRLAWAEHLTQAGIAYKFFSAHLAKEANERGEEEGEEEEGEKGEETEEGEGEEEEEPKEAPHPAQDTPDTHILTVGELEALFLQYAPADAEDGKLQVGLVGYPNVGKSSTINALIGAKKVSVSSTPGKTKHFQTIHLSERVVLCDCPGLVFPNFATTKADLVCNGILPIDQLREFSGPAGLVAARIPKHFLEAVYGIRIRSSAGPDAPPTAEDLLTAYARARGFTKTGQGQPDESRAARYILKDYVNGKLLFVAPPPGLGIDPAAFNAPLYDPEHLPAKRRLASDPTAALAAMSVGEDEDEDEDVEEDEDEEDMDDDEEDDDEDVVDAIPLALPTEGAAAQRLDKAFFQEVGRRAAAKGKAGGAPSSAAHVNMPFSHKYTQQGQAAGKQLSGRKARLVGALAQGLDAQDARAVAASAAAGKKHFKGGAKGRGKKKVPSNALEEE